MESITGGNTPKYQELTEQLRLQIVSGEIAPGQKLPSENTLSAQYQVSRQTVRKALAILQNEGYIYAEHGRGTFCSEMMRHAHPSKNIAVVTTYLSDYIFPRVIQGIDDVLTGAGYSIVLKNTKNSRTREAECLQEILSKDIDGVIIEPSKSQIFCRHMNLYEQLEKSHIPYVFIQGCFPQMKDKPHVLLDDFQGGYMITKYLTDHGHKNIVGVFKADDMQGQSRHKGMFGHCRRRKFCMIRIKWCGFIRRTAKSIPMKQSVKWQEKRFVGGWMRSFVITIRRHSLSSVHYRRKDCVFRKMFR